MWHASSANAPAVTCSRCSAYTARRRPTVKVPEEPSPLPEGMSARLTISIAGGTSCCRSVSRMIG